MRLFSTGGGPDGCVGPLGPPRDPSTLTKCCEENLGYGHCLSDIPESFSSRMVTCPSGGYCVPDEWIRTGGVFVPRLCKSIGKKPGACVSVCIADVAKNADLLPMDICADGERCAPCTDPRDGTPTGACEADGQCLGEGPPPPTPDAAPSDNGDDPATCVYDGDEPVVDPTSLPACAGDAHCLRKDLVPADFQDRLAACADTTKLCVPDLFLETGGDFILPTCRSVNDSEGRCVSRVIPEVKEQEATLPQSTCTVHERCVPCYSPLDGMDTGSCRISCDTGPKEPAKPLSACCEDRAKCVPKELISEDDKKNLKEDTCKDVKPDTYLCVPKEMLDSAYVPPSCMAKGLLGDYTGVCLSECLDFGIQGFLLVRGDCAEKFKCAPCVNPITKEPTGAPGCM
ncbi:MAG: hypothetical protein HY698_03935 [Deltaproteobacteria bacterium]|nr:hypothetical protein [Deltaproteobacteria bacterium]